MQIELKRDKILMIFITLIFLSQCKWNEIQLALQNIVMSDKNLLRTDKKLP